LCHTLEVILGLDTHEDEHVAALVDELGRLLAIASFEATTCGYRQLLAWVCEYGAVCRAGVEGTGSFGVGLARFLARNQGPHAGPPADPQPGHHRTGRANGSLTGLSVKRQVQRCARLRPGARTAPRRPHSGRCAASPAAGSSSTTKYKSSSTSCMR
jgi:hypothetical protein